MDELDRMFRLLVRNARAHAPDLLSRPFELAELYQSVIPYRLHRRELALETNEDYELALTRLLAGERGYLAAEPLVRDALQRELASPNPDPSAFRQHAHAQVSIDPDAVRALLDDPAGASPRGPAGTPAFSAPPVAAAPMPAAPMPAAPMPAAPMPAAPMPAAPMPAARMPAPPPTPEAASSAFRPYPPAAPAAAPSSAPAPAAPPPPPRPVPMPAAPRPVPAPTAAPVRPSSGAAAADLGGPAYAGRTPLTVEGGAPCPFCNGMLPDGRRVTYCPHCGQNVTVRDCPACGTELEVGWKFCVTCGRTS